MGGLIYMALIRGITITLYDRVKTGVDGFNRPTYQDLPVFVDNVLVIPMSETEVLDTLNLTGRRAIYQLAIPKGDQHDWTDKDISFWGRRFRAVGDVLEGIDDLIPLDWNKKVRVEIING